MPFFVDGNPTQGEISEAINYLLSNFTQNVSADPNTGQVVGPDGQVQYYLYKYMFVKYADSFDGSVGFSNTPTNKGYYGLRNSDSNTESTNPADYIWTQVTGGFGTTKFLYYLTTGGRAIQFQVATAVPNTGWAIDPGTAIDLDFVTGASNSPANFVVIRVSNVSTAPTNAEVLSAIGRLPISGDLCTINYNSGLASIVYKYTTGWAIFQKYITGDLIVANSIVGSNIAANTITASNMVTGTITAASGIIANAAILTANIGTAQVDTLQIAGNAVTFPSAATSSTSGANVTVSLNSGERVFITAYSTGSTTYVSGGYIRTTTISVSGAASGTVNSAGQISPSDGIGGNVSAGMTLGAVYTAPSTGSFTFTVTYSGTTGSSYGATGIQVIGLKR